MGGNGYKGVFSGLVVLGDLYLIIITPNAVSVVKMVNIKPMLVMINSKLLVIRISKEIPDCNNNARRGIFFSVSFAK